MVARASKNKKAVPEREEFMANISHEIRTPLNAIIGLTNLLKNSPLNEEQQKYVFSIEKSGEILMAIINDILDMAKIEAGKISIEPSVFSLKDSLKYVHDIMSEKASEKGLKLLWEIDNSVEDELFGDAARLIQVLINLTGNAIKFTSKGNVKISVHSKKHLGNKVDLYFDIEDTGIGIPEDKISSIFNSFTQVHHDKYKYGGTGLGLAIVKKLLELQGGRIQVTSTLGKGSCFKIMIPFLIPGKQLESKHIKSTGKELKGKKILIVEDNEINILLIKKLIEEAGATTTIVRTGEEAIKVIKKNPACNLVLLDIMLPDSDGYTIAKIIRAAKKSIKDVPILAMTAQDMEEHIKICIDAGINGLIMKPFNPEDLFTKIRSLTGKGPALQVAKDKRSITNQPNNDLIDLKFLRNLSEDDPDFIKEVATMFIDTIPGTIASMQQDVEGNNWRNLKLSAHKIKSSFGFLGIHAVEELMRQIERGCEYPNKQHLNQLVDQAYELAGKSISALKDELKALSL